MTRKKKIIPQIPHQEQKNPSGYWLGHNSDQQKMGLLEEDDNRRNARLLNAGRKQMKLNKIFKQSRKHPIKVIKKGR
jgi:hypothetical protein